MLRHVTSKDPNQYFTHFISNAVSSVRVVVSQKSEVQKHMKLKPNKPSKMCRTKDNSIQWDQTMAASTFTGSPTANLITFLLFILRYDKDVAPSLLFDPFIQWFTRIYAHAKNESQMWTQPRKWWNMISLSQWRPGNKSLNFIFPTKYVIPKSLKFSHWPSKWEDFDVLIDYNSPRTKKWSPSPSLSSSFYIVLNLKSCHESCGHFDHASGYKVNNIQIRTSDASVALQKICQWRGLASKYQIVYAWSASESSSNSLSTHEASVIPWCLLYLLDPPKL